MIKGGITILQWNCRGIYKKLPELKNYLSSFKNRPDLLVLQETHLMDPYAPRIHGYTIFRKDKSISSGGLAIFVRDNLPAYEVNEITSSKLEIQCIRVQNLHIYNIYIPPDCRLEDNDLNFLNKLPSRTIILGDFNAHHLSWSTSQNSINNQRGRKLAESLDKNEIVILNVSQPTRINLSVSAVNRYSLLDLTLASSDIAAKIQTHVTDALMGSDHFVILTTVNDKVVRSDPMPRKWSFNKANWKKFSQLVHTRLESDISLNSNIEELNSTITRSIITAAESTIPRTKNVGKRPIPWWNSDCQRAVRRKKAAFLKMKRTFNIDDVLAFKKSRSECRRTILNAKRRC